MSASFEYTTLTNEFENWCDGKQAPLTIYGAVRNGVLESRIITVKIHNDSAVLS